MRSLIHWKKDLPLSSHATTNPFLPLQTELDKAMDDFYKMTTSPHFLSENFEGLAINPSADLVEDEKSFKLEVELPGIDEKDVKVSIGDGMLTIKAEKKISRKDETKHYLMREIGYGSYERSFLLPDSANIDAASASFKKGMLWVTLPKKTNATKVSRELPIEKC